ncbi:hypothetical protein [Brevundimonas sp. A19_0]|uniref:hypothetical protein n=1 Tax=Brevundimonas sp. A19_0 TaxID=2821087 RepID=UPI001ADD25A9|nr:hypothetical protein [Brevundimonas sp. A19_0]MBO9502509.1 hypothetical protein [Brevundimonas sp. A19_0]
MTNRKCRRAVRGVVGDTWTDTDIDALLDRIQARRGERRAADPLAGDAEAMQAAADEVIREDVTEALLQRRVELFAKQAREERARRLEALPGDEADKLRAYDVGSEAQGPFTGASVDAEGRARTVMLWGMIERGLSKRPGLRSRLVSEVTGRSDPDFERNVAREMARLNGAKAVKATGDADAVEAARLFVDALEAARRMQNREGAWIGKIEGYIGRQTHDRLKVAGGFWREVRALSGAGLDFREAANRASRKAFRDWHDHIRPRLDERTFAGVRPDPEAAQALKAAGILRDAKDARELFLYQAWANIVEGRHDAVKGASDLGEWRPPGGTATAVSRSRVLHFAGPDAWMDYTARYGQGGLYGTIMGDLDRAARNSALMARWGPNPEAARQAEIDRLITSARARGDLKAVDKLKSRMRQAEFDELTGALSAPENVRLAVVGRSIRALEVLSKLGGVVLSAMSDGSLAAQRMKRAGGTYLDGYAGMAKGVARLDPKIRKEVADSLDVGARSAAAHLTARFAASDGPLGWAAWMQRAFFKVNGFQAWMDGGRQGLASMLSNVWGRQADRAWGALEAGTREDFTRFGLNEQAWDVLRAGAVDPGDGRRYLTMDAVETADEAGLLDWYQWNGKGDRAQAVRAAREDLGLRLRTLIGATLDDALTEPRARERVTLTAGMRPGTAMGEAARFFTQFLSFSQAVIGRHLVPAMKGYAGQHPVSLLAHMIVASTALGYVSLQMKQLVKGRTPRGFEDEDGNSMAGSLFIASLLQGGGLGIYGDFLFGEANRNGLPATISSFAGPAVSDAERLFAIVNRAVWGDMDEKADAGGDLAKFAVTSAPGANLFYTRAALDYLVLYRMQEAMSPGYLERWEKRVREREASEFLVDPSEAVTGQ